MKMTPFAKLFLTVVILGVLGFTLYLYRDELKGMARKDGSGQSAKPAGGGAAPGPAGKPEPDDRADFADVNRAAADPGKGGVTGVASAAVGAQKLDRALIPPTNTRAGPPPGPQRGR